jgi:polyisoprenoid-binding protein YceI
MAFRNNLIFAFLCIASLPAFAGTLYKVAPESSAEFLAVGRPSMLKVRGTGAKVTGSFDAGSSSSGDLAVDLDQFTTGMNLRDKHMKEKYLETGTPENKVAHFKLKKITPSLPQSGTTQAELTGDFTLHGVTKEMIVKTAVSVDGNALTANPTFKLKLTDYGIAIPSFAGVTVAEEVDITIDLHANKEAK